MNHDYFKKLAKEGSIFLLLCYIAGFIAWNYYLSHFSFFEYDLLQTRFLSAGFLILFIPLTIFILIKRFKEFLIRYNTLQLIFLFLIWVFVFSFFFFSYIPQYLGGAKPYVVSFITNSEISESFKLMGISLEEGNNKSVETLKSCKIYENKEIILAGFIFMPSVSTTTFSLPNVKTRVNRVLIINKSEIESQSVLPSNNINYQISCEGIRYVYGVDPYEFTKLFVERLTKI